MLLLFPPKLGISSNFSVKNHKTVGGRLKKASKFKKIIIKEKIRKGFVNGCFNLNY